MNGTESVTAVENEYTSLPFYNNFTAAKIFAVVAVLIIAFLIIKAVISKNSLTLHRAPFSVCTAYINIALINIIFCTFMYWYWALPLSLALTLIYMHTTYMEVKDANSEERSGVWGLNKDIRRIRGELFNDLPIEEQLAYREKVKDYKFSRIVFVVVAMLIPLAFIGVCYLLDIGYLFYPVIIE